MSLGSASGRGALRARSPSSPASPRPTSAEFPVLAREGLVYLDTAATAQTVRPALEAMDRYYETYRASIHRGVYPLAAEATDAYEGARDKVAAFTGSTPRETVFTRNATEALNLVAGTWGRANVGSDDLVVLTQIEHHSNIVPWQLLGCRLAYVPMGDDGLLDLDVLDALLAQRPKLVAVTHVSNVVGTINPIAEIAERAHAAGALVCVDGAQAVPHIPVDVAALDADFYAWTGHKAYGPTGIGVLHGRRELLEAMPPFLGGGHMIARVGDFESTWAEPPAKFEAGTMPVAEAIGLGAAVDWLAGMGMEAVREHGRDITGYALERLAEVPGLTVHGPADADLRGSLAGFALDGVHPHDVAEILGREGVCVRAGHHCAQPLMRRLGVAASTRASFAVHTTREDVDRLIDGLGTVREIFA
ncbi:MAG TPA: SufS family cysteine desulfurase [Solirubrobacter sp.]|nr:SufS family cysteine desulfurase [Solirubrobacter sp.]